MSRGVATARSATSVLQALIATRRAQVSKLQEELNDLVKLLEAATSSAAGGQPPGEPNGKKK